MDPALERLARERMGRAPATDIPADGPPARAMPDGTPCWCVSEEEPHEGWAHSPVCAARRELAVHPHTLLASPRGRDCVTYLDLGPEHRASQACPCGPLLVRCGEETVWLHRAIEEDGVKIGADVP